MFRCVGGRCFCQSPPELAGIWRNREISEGKSFGESVAFRAAVPRFIGIADWHSGFFWRFRASGDIEDQSPAVVEGDFFGLPGGR